MSRPLGRGGCQLISIKHTTNSPAGAVNEPQQFFDARDGGWRATTAPAGAHFLSSPPVERKPLLSLKIVKAGDLKAGDRYARVFQLDSKRTVASLTRTHPAIIDGAIAADAEVVLLPPIKAEWPTEGVIGIDEDGERSAHE